MVKVRALLGLEVATETRLEHLRKFVAEYERICKVHSLRFYSPVLGINRWSGRLGNPQQIS